MDFKIAAQMFTLREYMQTPEDMKETLKKVKDMGYKAVQISGIGNVDETKANAIADITKELRLKVCATHISLDQLQNEIDWVIKFHKLWDCKYVGIGSMSDEYRISKEKYIEFAQMANKIGQKLKENNLVLIYHNHRFEFEKFENKVGMEILYEYFDPQYVQFEIDTYWIQAGGANPSEWIRKVDGRMGVVHFKDMAIRNNEQIFGEIGSGNLDWDEIIKACKETDVEWAAVERDSGDKDAFLSLKESYDYLHSKGLE